MQAIENGEVSALTLSEFNTNKESKAEMRLKKNRLGTGHGVKARMIKHQCKACDNILGLDEEILIENAENNFVYSCPYCRTESVIKPE